MRQDYYFEVEPFEIHPEVDAYEVFDPGLTGETWSGEVNRKNRSYIRWVQQSLNQIMGLRLPIDGILGPATRSAIRSFQRRQGLPVDGIAGPKTKRALIAAVKISSSGAVEPESFEALIGSATSSTKDRLKTFTCSSTERSKIEGILSMSVTSTYLRGVIDSAARQAVIWANNAAGALRISPRTSTTIAQFFEVFGAEPSFVPSWHRATDPWIDFGDLIAQRLQNAAKILEGGEISYFCWGSNTHCPGCALDPKKYHACSVPDIYSICLGSGFWEAFAAGDMPMMASTLLHEAEHIFYGDTVKDYGNSNNAWCYQRFMLSFNGQYLHPDITRNCPIKLHRGDTGLPVRELQNRINRWIAENPGHGLRQRDVDGAFGPNTESDIKVIQSVERLGAVDGVVGADTWNVLPPKRFPILYKGRLCGANNPSVSCTNIMELKYRLNLWLRTQPGRKLLPVDKEFDSATENAVKLFQRENGLTDDGKVGERTWEALPQY